MMKTNLFKMSHFKQGF